MKREFFINNTYRTKKGELVVFLGFQDAKRNGKTHGFFRYVANPNTFFGLKLSEIAA